MKKNYKHPILTTLEIILDDVVLSSSTKYDEDAQNDVSNVFDW